MALNISGICSDVVIIVCACGSLYIHFSAKFIFRTVAHAFNPVHIHVVERNSIVVPIPLISVCFVYACEWMSVYSLH